MNWVSTAPTCIVVDCDGIASLSETAKGRFWHFESSYCSDCYTALEAGEQRQIDPSRLVLRPTTAGIVAEGMS